MRPTGDFWRKDWFRIYETLPDDAYDGGRDWDTAFTKQEANSASAYIETYRGKGKDGQFPIYIHDVDWDWREFPALVQWMRSKTGPHYVEQKASGKSAVQSLGVEGIAAHEVPVKGDKFARAAAVQPVVSNRRVWIRKEVAHQLLYGERQGLLRVTAEQLQADGPDLDVNDAFVQALTRHVGLYARRVAFG
jgi:phage terminase large subunit-like protein